METRLTLDHIAITVHDMERAVTCCRDVLGFAVLAQLVHNDGAFELAYLRAGAGASSHSPSPKRVAGPPPTGTKISDSIPVLPAREADKPLAEWTCLPRPDGLTYSRRCPAV